MDPGIYRQEIWTINRSAGSTFDRWIEMGAPGVMTPEDLKYLNDMAQPLCKIRDTDTVGTLRLQAELEPHEVRLIVLKKRWIKLSFVKIHDFAKLYQKLNYTA